jgi:cytochrome P450
MNRWSVALALAGGITVSVLIFRKKSMRNQARTRSKVPSRIKVADLVDPNVRSDHLAFNKRLMAEYPDVDAIELDDDLDGNPVFLVHQHQRVVDVINNHLDFTSNPWPGSRSLVTLNTMDKDDHDRVLKVIKQFYSPSAVGKLENEIRQIISRHGETLKKNGDALRFAKRLHMQLSLCTSGLISSADVDNRTIDRFIEWNDSAVLLAAPLGGVGLKPRYTLSRLKALVVGSVNSVSGVIGLVRRIGLMQTMNILNPIESFFPSAPYTHAWDYPGALSMIPEYFNHLYDLMAVAGAESPAGSLFRNIGVTLSASEAIATLVQLMVNMTTANAIMSLIYRMSIDKSVGSDQILFEDAPLQRNPRRARNDSMIGSVSIPKGAVILLMLGSANLSCPYGKPGMSFGLGLHHCLGRHLVSLEMKLVEEWIRESFSSSKIVVDEYTRLVDRDVGNWGFSRLQIGKTQVG